MGGGGGERGWGSTHCCHLVNEWMRKMGDIWQRCRDGGEGVQEGEDRGGGGEGRDGGGGAAASILYVYL